jgi:hypothetical protein
MKTSKLPALRCTICRKTVTQHLAKDLGHMFIIERETVRHLYSQKLTRANGESTGACGDTSVPETRIVRDPKKVNCLRCQALMSRKKIAT